MKKTVLLSYTLALGFCVMGILIAYMRVRYAIAFYLVIFGSIIVAAYKMGMVHEKPRVVSPKVLGDNDATAPPPDVSSSNVLEIKPPKPPQEPPEPHGRGRRPGDLISRVKGVP